MDPAEKAHEIDQQKQVVHDLEQQVWFAECELEELQEQLKTAQEELDELEDGHVQLEFLEIAK